MLGNSHRRHWAAATVLAMLIGSVSLASATASADSARPQGDHYGSLESRRSAAATSSAQAAEGPQPAFTPAGDGGGVDTANDTFPIQDCHGDINGFAGSYTSQQILVTHNTFCGSNPNTSPNWTQNPGSTGIIWAIDLNGDGSDDFQVIYLNDGVSLKAGVFNTAGSNFSQVCDATPGWDGNAGFAATFAPACIGSPGTFSMQAFMTWDESPSTASCSCPFDVAPDGFGYSAPISRSDPFVPLGDGPAAASAGTGVEDAFARGGDDALWTQHFNGSSWSGWASLGGIITGAPGAASMAPGIEDVFVRGADDALWTNHFNGTIWSGWTTLGGILKTAPGVVSSSPGTLDVFVAGADDALWTNHFNGSAWSGWTSLGGIITAEPGVASASAGTTDVFARGGDDALWTNHFNGSIWSGWTSLGGILSSGPGAASANPNTIDVFARGGDNSLWTNHFNGSAWGGWISLGGVIASPAAPVSDAVNTLDVFARGGDSALWTQHFNGSAWGGWVSLGGIIK